MIEYKCAHSTLLHFSLKMLEIIWVGKTSHLSSIFTFFIYFMFLKDQAVNSNWLHLTSHSHLNPLWNPVSNSTLLKLLFTWLLIASSNEHFHDTMRSLLHFDNANSFLLQLNFLSTKHSRFFLYFSDITSRSPLWASLLDSVLCTVVFFIYILPWINLPNLMILNTSSMLMTPKSIFPVQMAPLSFTP